MQKVIMTSYQVSFKKAACFMRSFCFCEKFIPEFLPSWGVSCFVYIKTAAPSFFLYPPWGHSPVNCFLFTVNKSFSLAKLSSQDSSYSISPTVNFLKELISTFFEQITFCTIVFISRFFEQITSCTIVFHKFPPNIM